MLPPFAFMVYLTMNLINGPYHECERRERPFSILRVPKNDSKLWGFKSLCIIFFFFFNVRRKSFCNKILQNQPKVRHLQLYMYVYVYVCMYINIPCNWLWVQSLQCGLAFFFWGWGGGFSWKPPTASFDRMHMGGI